MTGQLPALQQASKKKKKKTVGFFDAILPEHSGETIDSLDYLKPKAVGKAVTEQVKPEGDWLKDWLGLGGEAKGHQGGHSVDMQPGVSYSPSHAAEAQKHQEQAAEAPIEAPMNYAREILHAGENANKRHEQESGQKVQMLIQELHRLAQSVQQIEKTMILQAIDPAAGKKTGKYYESFFEWMLMVVQDARRQVEDSGAWLSAMSGKKKGGIHKTMKSNMQVAMSGERTQANNAG